MTIIHLSFHTNVLHIEWFLMNFDLVKGKETWEENTHKLWSAKMGKSWDIIQNKRD
jgi:hypothetical protein